MSLDFPLPELYTMRNVAPLATVTMLPLPRALAFCISIAPPLIVIGFPPVNEVDAVSRMIVPAPVFTIPSIDDVSTLEYVSSPLSTLNVRMFPSNVAVAHAENIVTAAPVSINSFFIVFLSLFRSWVFSSGF